MYDVTALGELLIDFTNNGLSENNNILFEANPGGAPCNVLAMLSKLGRKTAFIGKVGDDILGNILKKSIEECGIDSTYLLLDKNRVCSKNRLLIQEGIHHNHDDTDHDHDRNKRTNNSVNQILSHNQSLISKFFILPFVRAVGSREHCPQHSIGDHLRLLGTLRAAFPTQNDIYDFLINPHKRLDGEPSNLCDV